MREGGRVITRDNEREAWELWTSGKEIAQKRGHNIMNKYWANRPGKLLGKGARDAQKLFPCESWHHAYASA